MSTPVTQDPKDVVVVGAGLVGSLWSLYLARRGHRVTVLERRPDMRRVNIPAGRSINLACSVRGFSALDEVGVGDLVREDAIAMKGRMIHDKEGATNLQPYGEEGQAIYSISRGGLNKTLMTRAEEHENVTIRFDQRVLSVDLDKPSLHVEDAEGKHHTIETDLIFGCDGAFSAVRSSMMTTDRFDYSQTWLSHGYKELTIPATADGGFRMEKNALHIWPREEFMLIALPNPEGDFTCTLFFPFEGETSFATLDTVAKARAFFEKEFKDALALMPTFDEDWEKNPASSLATFRCFPWQQGGKVCLLGDAAHGIVPFYGQGMVSGFEDCAWLERILDEEGGDWEKALPRFSDERKPQGDAIADLALYNFIEMRDRVADPSFVLQKKIERKIHAWYGDKYLPLYSMVTFSQIPYADAWAYGREQEKLMQGILAIDGIESKWDSAEMEPVIKERVDAFLAKRA